MRTVATNVTLYERTDLGWPATVYNTDGHTPRPKLATPAWWKTVHYTGASVNYEDAGDFVRECQDLERYAVSAGKSNEYNWIVGADGPDKACIATYAGDYQAAHSSGENDRAIGILFMNGVGQRVTDSEVLAFRWLVADLAARGRTDATTSTTPHKEMPDAATACPGDQVLARWNELLVPYSTNGGGPVSDDDHVRQLIRDVLNEAAIFGTGANNWPWAESFQNLYNNVIYLGDDVTELQAAVDQIIGQLQAIRRHLTRHERG